MTAMQGALPEARICAVIAGSELFDGDWYLEQYPDVRATGMDPVLHYSRFGEKEGRRPSDKTWAAIWQEESSGNRLCDYVLIQEAIDVNNVIPVVFACDDNYAPYLSVAIASLIRNASPENSYALYIFYNQMAEENLSRLCSQATANVRILPLCVAPFTDAIVKKAFVNGHVSKETYFRILIPRLLSQYSKCVYLDSDLVINSDIAQLYRQKLGSAYVAAAEELNSYLPYRKKILQKFPKPPVLYFNAGVLLMNINKFIEFNLFDKFIDRVESGIKYANWDQDIMNIICDGFVARLDGSWNYSPQHFMNEYYKNMDRELFHTFASDFENPNIVHFSSSKKPWKHDDGYFAGYFWKYAQYSPYYASLKQSCPYAPEKAR